MNSFKGRFTISRVTNEDGGYVMVEVEDEISSCIACNVRMPVTDFADALMGRGGQYCTFELNESGVVGKRRELRDIEIPRPPSRGPRFQESNSGLLWIRGEAAHELVDGWEPLNPTNVFNSHHWTDGGKVRVRLIRFVDAE